MPQCSPMYVPRATHAHGVRRAGYAVPAWSVDLRLADNSVSIERAVSVRGRRSTRRGASRRRRPARPPTIATRPRSRPAHHGRKRRIRSPDPRSWTGSPSPPKARPPSSIISRRERPRRGRVPDDPKPGRPRPPRKQPATVRIPAVPPQHRTIDRQPAVQPPIVGRPHHRGVVTLANRDDAPTPGHLRHRTQRRDRVGKVMKDLVSMNHIERRLLQRHRPDIAFDEHHIRQAAFGCTSARCAGAAATTRPSAWTTTVLAPRRASTRRPARRAGTE